MQQYRVHQEQQICVLQDDRQDIIQEISALRSLAEVVGVASSLLAELDVFKHEVEHLDARAWELKEVRLLKRNELVRLSLSVMRAPVHGQVERKPPASPGMSPAAVETR